MRVRAGAPIVDGRGSASRTRTRSAIAHAAPSSRPTSWRPATRAPGIRSSSYQARLVAAGLSRAASRPVSLRASQASSTARSRRSRASPIGGDGASAGGPGGVSAPGVVVRRRWPARASSASALRSVPAADGASPTKTRSVRARIRAAIAAASPVTPVASAMARRNAAIRPSSSASWSGVATPSMTATVRPSAKTARIGPWIGSSWSSRIASSRDGTPRPARRPASRAHWPATPSQTSRNSQKTWRRVGVERDLQAALPELAARPDVLEARPGVPERDERRRIVGQPEALRQRPPDLPLGTVGDLTAYGDERWIRPVVDPNRLW